MHKAFLGVEPARIQWREIERNGKTYSAPYSPNFDDIYFNTQDGIAESEYVFIQGNRLSERFSKHPSNFSIFETGFGSGLNFLLTAKLWQSINPSGHLHYYSVEQFPVLPKDLVRIYQELDLDNHFIEPLLKKYPPILPGVFPIEISSQITLHLIFYPLDKALKEIALNDKAYFDAWFLDGFAPSKNPTMWHKGLWHFMALKAVNLENTKTTVATFTAASEVRRMLQNYGFEVSKRKGFGFKREMLTAEFNKKKLSTPKPNLASIYCETKLPPKKVAIIGTGLAGTALAYQLNKNNIEVHLFEKASSIATGASKMPALLAMPNLSIDHNSFSQLTFTGLKFISEFLVERPTLLKAKQALQLISDKYSRYQLEQYFDIYKNRTDIKLVDDSSWADFALQLFAVQVNGPELCQAFVKDIPESQIHFDRDIQSLEQLAEFDQIVISAGHHQLDLGLPSRLPATMPLRGQLTGIKAPKLLQSPINYDQHLFQEQQEWYLGATFESLASDELFNEDDEKNINHANKQFNLTLSLKHKTKSYAGVRASSFDRFPFCGLFTQAKKQSIWLNYGYGTRGLCLSLLGAEVICSSMLNKTLPISKTLLQRLNPLRTN